MSLIQKALQEVRNRIPEEILMQAFIDRSYRNRGLPLSVDYKIRQKIIDGRVKVDIDLVGGTEDLIPLTGLVPDRIDQYTLIYNIPKNLTQGRTITNALSITYGDAYRNSTSLATPARSSAIMNAADNVLDSNLPIPVVSSARVRLLAENTILIEDNTALPRRLYLRCVLENDDELNNIRPPAWHAFCKLVVLATKAYIYNKLSIRIDEAFLSGGMTVGRVREFVDEYADANELYDEFLHESWKKISVFNDDIARRRHLQSITGGAW